MRAIPGQRRLSRSLVVAAMAAAHALFGTSARAQGAAPDSGTVVGRVTDAPSGQGLAGAAVNVEGTRIATLTGEDGRYRIADVPPGTHTLVARFIGHTPERRSVTVSGR